MKKAFSFAEILISMMIVSVLFLAGAKVLTQPRKEEIARKVHGVYECYYNDGVLTEAMSKTGEPATGIPADGNCVFTPARGSSMYGITVIYGDRMGDETFSTFYNNSSMIVIPPTVGAAGNGNTASFRAENLPSKDMSPKADAQKLNTEQYKMLVNRVLTYGKNVHINDSKVKAGNTGKNGAVIITW